MLEYGRDNQAAPLRELGDVLDAVATGRFKPDVTRSGMMETARAEAGDEKPVAESEVAVESSEASSSGSESEDVDTGSE
eukprot:9784262-Heterocapsa_arctica.AAC.1